MLEEKQINYLFVSAYNAALAAGAKVLKIYNGGGDFEVTIKSDNTPITLADKESHETIKSLLSQTRIPLLSEEGRDLIFEERSGWDLFWLVDPLDGTREFIKRNGEFTINIALMVDNEPLVGIVYLPQLNKIYFSLPDRGAFVKDNVAPDLNAAQSLSEIINSAVVLPLCKQKNSPAKIAVSRSHYTDETKNYINILSKEYGDVEVVIQGSSLKLCMIAEGAVDIYPRMTETMEWDTAAGEAIIRGAGASIVNIETGENLYYNKENLVNPYFICKSAHCK